MPYYNKAHQNAVYLTSQHTTVFERNLINSKIVKVNSLKFARKILPALACKQKAYTLSQRERDSPLIFPDPVALCFWEIFRLLHVHCLRELAARHSGSSESAGDPWREGLRLSYATHKKKNEPATFLTTISCARRAESIGFRSTKIKLQRERAWDPRIPPMGFAMPCDKAYQNAVTLTNQHTTVLSVQ